MNEEEIEIIDDTEIFGPSKKDTNIDNSKNKTYTTREIDKELKKLSDEENLDLKKILNYKKKEVELEQKNSKEKFYQYLLSLLMWIAFVLGTTIVIYLFISYKQVILDFFDKII